MRRRRGRVAPDLVGGPASGRWPWERLAAWWTERSLTRRIEAERVLEWRRIAPGGTPIWVLPDEVLESRIDQLAASSRARTVEITYYLEERARRQQGRMNEVVAEANTNMVRLTKVIVVMTALVLVLAAVTTIDALTR
jgi:hypothetical protein